MSKMELINNINFNIKEIFLVRHEPKVFLHELLNSTLRSSLKYDFNISCFRPPFFFMMFLKQTVASDDGWDLRICPSNKEGTMPVTQKYTSCFFRCLTTSLQPEDDLFVRSCATCCC